MPVTVFTLSETTDRTGYVLTVFEDRAMALDAAQTHAQHRIERCIAMDKKTFGKEAQIGPYEMVVNEPDAHANVTIVHVPTGELDVMAWQVWPFDVVPAAGKS